MKEAIAVLPSICYTFFLLITGAQLAPAIYLSIATSYLIGLLLTSILKKDNNNINITKDVLSSLVITLALISPIFFSKTIMFGIGLLATKISVSPNAIYYFAVILLNIIDIAIKRVKISKVQKKEAAYETVIKKITLKEKGIDDTPNHNNYKPSSTKSDLTSINTSYAYAYSSPILRITPIRCEVQDDGNVSEMSEVSGSEVSGLEGSSFEEDDSSSYKSLGSEVSRVIKYISEDDSYRSETLGSEVSRRLNTTIDIKVSQGGSYDNNEHKENEYPSNSDNPNARVDSNFLL